MTQECVQIGDCTLVHGDCFEVLPTLPPVDVVVTDPPYGAAGAISGRRRQDGLRVATRYECNGWNDDDSYIESCVIPVVTQCVAITRRGAVTPGFKQMWKYPTPKHIGNLYYGAQSATTPWGMAYWQPILFYGRDPHPMTPDTIQARPNPPGFDVGHPCPKELRSWQALVERASAATDMVLDPFMGSGTTGIACVRTGRKFIGIEREKAYFDIAVNRIRREVELAKCDLFKPKVVETQRALFGEVQP